MPRSWTAESITAWKHERKERRVASGYKPIEALSGLKKDEALEAERKALIETEFSRLTTQSWNLGKHPLTSFAAPFSGVILAPQNYSARHGIDRLKVRKGQDLNKVVHDHYHERVDSKAYPGENYVATDGIQSRRHEYMGPSPRLASYRFTGDQIEIEWWDKYFDDTWVGTQKWKVEAELDVQVEGWFVIDRNKAEGQSLGRLS